MLPSRSFLARLHEFYSPAEHGERADAIEAAIERSWRQVGTETRTLEIDRTLFGGPLRVAITVEGRHVAVHDLPAGQYYIGRYEGCQIRLEPASVSRVHALLTVHADHYMTISDLWSRNGVSVNGRAIPPGAPHPVRGRDEIRLGDAVLTFTCQ